jgi:serine/threonine protein kinase
VIAGRYSLDREIGRGGMGAVWLGQDEVLGRRVALKRIGLLPGADSTDLARAEREARLAAQLSHPNVVAVFNVVVDPDTDSRWLVMEYVPGTTLARLVKDEGPLPPDEAAPLLRQVADALVAAHAAGIVHRDVKPSNVLVDRNRRAKLTDFGIARTMADPSLTQTGLVTGSPAYLAPEVAAGRRGDESADVWSLGATAYHLLSGHPPYDMGDNVLGGLYRIVNEEPPRLPEAGPLAPLIEGTMVKDPARRWSMVQVRDFLTAPGGRVPPVPPVLPADGPGPDEADEAATRVIPHQPRGGLRVGLVALAFALTLALGLFLVLRDGEEPAVDSATDRPTASASGSPAESPTRSPTESASSPTAEPAPTARGMRDFVRAYVAAVASDPDTAWRMLTPKFQAESGGLDRYRDFWSGVGPGRILAVRADPESLVVSYRVRFENFGTGRRPTVLELEYDGGRYRIDGERTAGFEPAG